MVIPCSHARSRLEASSPSLAAICFSKSSVHCPVAFFNAAGFSMFFTLVLCPTFQCHNQKTSNCQNSSGTLLAGSVETLAEIRIILLERIIFG